MTARTLLLACRVCIVAGILLIGGVGQGALAAPNTQDGPTLIGYGQTVEGELTADQPTQTYAFDATANDVVTLAMESSGGDLDPFITLLDAQNVQLATDDNSGGGMNARLAFVIPTSGRYLARVSHAAGMFPVNGGRYSLTLTAVGEGGVVVERTPLPQPTPTPEATDPAQASGDLQGLVTRLRPIAPGTPIQDELTRQVAFHLYWFRANANDQVTINATGTGDFTPLATLYDAAFNEIGRTQPDQPSLAAILANSGVYLIGLSLPDAGNTGGAYTLELSGSLSTTDAAETEGEALVLPEEFQDATAIEFGQAVEGALDNQRSMDVYTFLGMAGQTVTIEMTGTDPEAINALDPYLILLDDASIPLVEHDDIVAGVERDARIEYTLPRTAYYAIVATRFDREQGTSAGPYRLTLSVAGEGGDSPPLLQSEPLQPNTPIQATFDQTPDVYRFEARAGELIDLSVTADPGVDPVLILVTSQLREVVSSGTGTLTGLRAPMAGSYYLIVATRFGPAGPTGGYILALSQPDREGVTPPPQASETEESATTTTADEESIIRYGQTVSGVIDDATPGRIYTLVGAAGDHVRISLRAADGSALDPYLEVRDADGAILANNDDIDPGVIRDSLLTLTLPADGEYQIIASRYVGPDTDITSGAYELTVEQITAEEAAAATATGSGEQTATTGATATGTNTNATLVPLRYGQTQVGTIDDDQFLLFFIFSGTEGDVVTVEVDRLSGNLDTVAHLYQASGDSWAQIAYNDDNPNGGTYDPLISDVTLPASGPYLIAVGRYGLEQESGMTGTFAITLTRQEPQEP